MRIVGGVYLWHEYLTFLRVGLVLRRDFLRTRLVQVENVLRVGLVLRRDFLRLGHARRERKVVSLGRSVVGLGRGEGWVYIRVGVV